MIIYTQLKTFTLLCILHATNIVASAPASQAVIPACLQAELKRIEDLPDHKALTEVIPIPISLAEQCLREYEDKFKGLRHSLASSQANDCRTALKYYTIKKELTSCSDGALKQTLQSKLNETENQWNAHRQEELRCARHCVKNQPLEAYDFMLDRYDALATQASILLAQKETEKAQWQQEKVQLQQEKQSLLVQLKGYQLLEDGLQIEGVPNVPGGVKPKLKRSGSF